MLSLPFSLLFIGSIIVCIIKSYFRDIIIQMNGIGPHGRWDETSRPLCSPYCCISLGRCVFARVHMIHKQTLAHPCSCSKYAPYFSLHFLARIERKKCQFLCVYSSFRFWAVSEGIIAFGEHGNVQQKWIYAWHNKLENCVSFDVCVCLCTKNDVTRKIYLWLFEQSKKKMPISELNYNFDAFEVGPYVLCIYANPIRPYFFSAPKNWRSLFFRLFHNP